MNNQILPSIRIHDLLQKACIGTWTIAEMTYSLELDETARQVLNIPDTPNPIPLDYFIGQLPVSHQFAFRSFLNQIQQGNPASCTLQHLTRLLSFKGFLQTGNPSFYYGTVEAIAPPTASIQPTEPHPDEASEIIGFSRDISQRKTTEEKLREIEARLRAIFTNTIESIWAVDQDYRLIFFNATAAKGFRSALGLELEIGLPILDEFRKRNILEWADTYEHRYYRTLQGESFMATDKFVTPDAIIHNEVRFSPVWQEGAIVGVCVVGLDVTQIRKDEIETSNLKNLLQSVLDASPAGIMAWQSVRDEQGQIVDFECLLANAKGAELAEKKGVDLKGKRLLEELPNSKTFGLFDICVNVVNTGKKVQVEHARNTKEGNQGWFFDTIVPLEDGFVATFFDITERKRAEEENVRLLKETQTLNEELRASEEELRQTLDSALELNKQLADSEQFNRQIIDNINGGIAVWDRAGHYVVWNAFLEKISGKTEKELLGRHPIEAFPELFEQDMTPFYLFQRALAGETVTFPDSYAEIGGTQHWYTGVYVPFRNSQGEIIGVLSTSSLITDRKKVEEENTRLLQETLTLNEELRQALDEALELNRQLADSEEFSKQVISSLQEGLSVFDREGKYIAWNAFMEKRLNMPAHQVLGKHYLDLFPFVKDSPLDGMYERALAGETIVIPDTYMDNDKPGGVWINGSYGPLKNSQGEIIGVVSTIKYISDRKLAELALLQQKNLLLSFYNATRFYVCVFELIEDDYIFQLPNQSLAGFYGLSVEELTGKTARDLQFPPEIIHRWYGLFKTCLETGQPMQVEYAPLHPDGRQEWHFASLSPIEGGRSVSFIATDITDRKRTEEENVRLLKETQTLNEELRASEEELRQTLDSALELNEKLAASEQFNKQIILGANEGIVVLDKAFRYILCNPFMEKRLGLPAAELIGKRPFDIFPEVYAQNPERYQLLERALAGETIVYPDYYAPLTETTGYWSTGSFSPLQNGHGEIIGVILTVNFITERKLAEQALLQQKNRLQAFYDAAQFQMCVFELTEDDYIFQLPNRHMAEFYGFSVEEMTGKTAKELKFPPEVINHWFGLFKTCLETGQPRQIEYAPVHSGGHTGWHVASFSRIGEGNTIAFIATDITERKQAEEAVRASEERLRLAQEATALGTWEWHLDSNELYCSDQVARIYGYEPSSFKSSYERVTSVIHPEDNPLIQEALQNSFENPEYRDLFHVLHRVLRSDGEWRWLEEYAKVYRNAEGIPKRLLGTVRDITEARLAQLQINELLAETQQFNQELAIREEELQQALDTEKRLNEELASREEELSSSEEELRQVNEQLMNNYRTLQEKELTLRRSHQIAQLGSWEFDMRTQRVFWSDEVHHIHEVPPGSVHTMENLKALVGEETLTAIQEAYTPQYELDYTFKTTTPRGNVKWVRLMGYPEKRGEEFIKITGIAHDITDFKQIEEKLRSSEEKFATAFDLSPNLLLIIRQKDSLIVEINRRTTDVMGFSKQELIGHSFDVFDFWEKPADKEHFKKMYAIQHSVELEATFRKKDGSTFDAIINTRLIEIEGENYRLNVIRDITEEKKAKQKIDHNTQELIALNKKMGEIKLMALRSVMNPHFIFNSLNSIQYFVAKNDRENAIHYLSLFSKLIRGVLSSSVKNKISLADEIELLMYYIKLELVRFNNQFDVHYDIDEELDLENIEIPSLLIQPFVENAILHGLYNKEGRGTLRIAVYQLEETLLFEVEDNGIGRKAAAAIKEKTLGKHQSVGMVLTKERLEIINQEYAVSVEVIDLYDHENATGTKVKLFLKL